MDIYLIAKNPDKHFLKLQKCMPTQNQRIIRSKQEAMDLHALMLASGRDDAIATSTTTQLLNADWSKSAKLASASSR